MPYFEKQIISGDLLEVERFFAPGKRPPRGPKLGDTPKGQKNLNEKNAQKDLVRRIRCNFDGERGDLFVTFTYAGAVDEQRAAKDARNLIDRLRRWAAKNGNPDFKYIKITEKQSKWHHHIIMNGMPLDELNKIWGRGRVTASILDKANNYEDLSKYLLLPEKQHKQDKDIENTKPPHPKHARRWSGSHNLAKPIVKVKPLKRESIMSKPPAAPKGHILLPEWVTGCDAFGHLHQTFMCQKVPPPKREKKKQRKRSKKLGGLNSG